MLTLTLALEATVGDDLIRGLAEGRDTKGRAKQYIKEGGAEQAGKDFDALNPSEVREKDGGVRVGTLPDGRTVVSYPESSADVPTLEIQDGKKRTKIRYQ